MIWLFFGGENLRIICLRFPFLYLMAQKEEAFQIKRRKSKRFFYFLQRIKFYLKFTFMVFVKFCTCNVSCRQLLSLFIIILPLVYKNSVEAMFAYYDPFCQNERFACESGCRDVFLRFSGTCVHFMENFNVNVAKICSFLPRQHPRRWAEVKLTTLPKIEWYL